MAFWDRATGRGPANGAKGYRIDALHHAKRSGKVVLQIRKGVPDAVHVTIACHGTFRETVLNIQVWSRRSEPFLDLIFQRGTAAEVARPRATGRTANFSGFQNTSPIEIDIGLLEVFHRAQAR